MDEFELTPEVLLEQVSSPARAVRWKAARLLAHAIDVGQARGAAFRAACVPVLLEILESHDVDTAFEAEDAARHLVDIGERTAEVRACMTRCLGRAEDELISLEAALIPIQNSTVAEADALRARIDSHGSLVASLRGYLEDFRTLSRRVVRAARSGRRDGRGPKPQARQGRQQQPAVAGASVDLTRLWRGGALARPSRQA